MLQVIAERRNVLVKSGMSLVSEPWDKVGSLTVAWSINLYLRAARGFAVVLGAGAEY